jgi:hypothetical protein
LITSSFVSVATFVLLVHGHELVELLLRHLDVPLRALEAQLFLLHVERLVDLLEVLERFARLRDGLLGFVARVLLLAIGRFAVEAQDRLLEPRVLEIALLLGQLLRLRFLLLSLASPAFSLPVVLSVTGDGASFELAQLNAIGTRETIRASSTMRMVETTPGCAGIRTTSGGRTAIRMDGPDRREHHRARAGREGRSVRCVEARRIRIECTRRSGRASSDPGAIVGERLVACVCPCANETSSSARSMRANENTHGT